MIKINSNYKKIWPKDLNYYNLVGSYVAINLK